ncbi:MAG TPA: PilZ domain-containing protein [Pirellulales bacterium]|nr:PilZ domain-containing protein [Pirellulales bacterium]
MPPATEDQRSKPTQTITHEAIDTLFDFEPEQLLRPPAAIEMFVRRIVRGAKYYVGPEQRTEPRYAVSLAVAAVPVDQSLKKAGDVFIAFTRDISSSGMAMYHTRRVSEKYLAVEIKSACGEKMRVLVEVLRCYPSGLFYEIAGKFVSRLAD